MSLQRLPDREGWLIDSLSAKMGQRREGKHLTDSVYCNIKAWGNARLGMAGYDIPKPDQASIIRMAVGIGLGDVIEEGHHHQVTTLSADDDSTGTIDVLYKGRVVEIKCTWQSSNKTPEDNPHWLEQTGGYAARNLGDHKSATAEFWIVHLGGDGGKKYCPEHGRGDEHIMRFYEPTGKQRMACNECMEFLVAGNRNPEVRCWSKTWEREELEALLALQASRQTQLAEDIKNPDYLINGGQHLPPIRWGYQSEFECKGCIIKERFTASSGLADIAIDQEHHVVNIGTMLGEACRLGGGVTAQPGVIVGNFSQVEALKLFRGRLPDRSMVF